MSGDKDDLIINGVPVSFPYTPYPAQVAYMTSVITALQSASNALLESPTGTGKTLCLLCAALGWLSTQEVLRDTSDPSEELRIYYCSRTHSQLAHVIREFKKTHYADLMIMSVLGSREHLCVHSSINRLPSAVQGCQCASLIADRKCRFHTGTTKYTASEKISVASGEKRNLNLHDIEDLCDIARQENFCPFFYEREITKKADIVFLPYNYIFDASLHAQLPVRLGNRSIIIVDEAHNIPSVLSNASSVTLSALDVSTAVMDLDKVIAVLQQMLSEANGISETSSTVPIVISEPALQIAAQGTLTAVVMNRSPTIAVDVFGVLTGTLKMQLIALENAVAAVAMPVESGDISKCEYVRSGTEIKSFLALPGVDITVEAFTQGDYCIANLLLTAVQLIMRGVSAGSGLMGGASGAGLQKLYQFLTVVFNVGLPDDVIDICCRFVIQEDKDGLSRRAVRNLSFCCLDVSVRMRAIAAEVKQLLLTSGTLSPIDHFAAELGIDFNVVLQGQHIVKVEEQILPFVLSKGPGGERLNSSYAFRQSRPYYRDLGRALVNVCVAVPDGVLVFFQSYSAMNTALEMWKMNDEGADINTIWGDINEHKTIFIEPVSSSELSAVVTEFQQTAVTRRGGALLIGVARGKISEGVDFADRHARCVVVCGIPFANHGDLFVRLKKEYLTSVAPQRPRINGRLFTGDDWYRNEAIRCVNQCIGRVIRHANDFGAIILADERFSNMISSLSNWITTGSNGQRIITEARSFIECFQPLARFFIERQPKYLRKAAEEAKQQRQLLPSNVDGVGVLVSADPPSTAQDALKFFDSNKSSAHIITTNNNNNNSTRYPLVDEISSHLIKSNELPKDLAVQASMKYAGVFAAANECDNTRIRSSVKPPECRAAVASSTQKANTAVNPFKATASGLKTGTCNSREFLSKMKSFLSAHEYDKLRAIIQMTAKICKQLQDKSISRVDASTSFVDTFNDLRNLFVGAVGAENNNLLQEWFDDFGTFVPSVAKGDYKRIIDEDVDKQKQKGNN